MAEVHTLNRIYCIEQAAKCLISADKSGSILAEQAAELDARARAWIALGEFISDGSFTLAIS